MAPKKKPPITSARTRQERIKQTGKAPASTPKGRQTTAMQRPFKPGTKTSNTTTKFAGQKALPAAGKSGGSQPPKGTTTPKKGGPTRTPAQIAQERRSAAAARKAGQNIRKPTSSNAPKSAGTPVGAATRAATRGGNLARNLKGAVKGGAMPLISAAGAVGDYVDARRRGETKGRSAAQAAAGFMGALGGARAGAMLGAKAGPWGAAIGSIGGGYLGYQAALKGTQGIQEAAKQAEKKGKPAKPNMYRGAYTRLAGTEALREKVYSSLQDKGYKQKATAKPKPVAPKAATTPTRSSAPSRSSVPARTTASRPAAKPAAKPKAPANMATESSMSASDIMKGYGMRVNQTFGAESAPTPKKRQSLREQTADIKKMIEESKKRQGKG
jgi:hypothetical protein